MEVKCCNCQYSIINQDADEDSKNTRATKFFCMNCDNVYCSSRCKLQDFTEGHKHSCGVQSFQLYEECGYCQRNGEIGPVCQTCNRFVESYNNVGGTVCQQKGPDWSKTVDWADIYQTMMDTEKNFQGGTEARLPGLIRQFGGCTCRGRYDCISPAQPLRFSWVSIGAKNISFNGCCPITIMDAFSQIGDLHVRMNANPNISTTAQQQIAAYKLIDSYWNHNVKMLFLIEHHLNMGILMARCADLSYLSMELQIAKSRFKELGKLAERTGFQVLGLLSTKGLGRIAMTEGKNQEALRLLTSSYDMIPFINVSSASSEQHMISGKQYQLDAMLRCVWDDESELSSWKQLLTLKNVYDEFQELQLLQQQKGATVGLYEIRALLCMNVNATLTEHIGFIPDAVSAYIQVVKTGQKQMRSVRNRYFVRDVKLHMTDALQRVQTLTTTEEYDRIATSLLQSS